MPSNTVNKIFQNGEVDQHPTRNRSDQLIAISVKPLGSYFRGLFTAQSKCSPNQNT